MMESLIRSDTMELFLRTSSLDVMDMAFRLHTPWNVIVSGLL
jgi:hypothetical protein